MIKLSFLLYVQNYLSSNISSTNYPTSSWNGPALSLFTPNQIKIIELGLGIGSLLSVCGTLFMIADIIFRMIRYKRSHKNELKLIRKNMIDSHSSMEDENYGSINLNSSTKTAKDLFILVFFGEILCLNLAVSDLGASLWYIGMILHREISGSCDSRILPFIGTVFEPASILWVCCFSTAFAKLLMKSRNFQTTQNIVRSLKKYIVTFSIVSWCSPLLLAGVYYVTDNGTWFGADIWCWVQYKRITLWLFYFPVIIAFAYNIILLVTILIINKKKRLGLKNFNLFWYIPVFILIWVIPTIHALYQHITGSAQTPFVLQLISSLTLPSQGFFNAIVWTAILRTSSSSVLKQEEEVILLGKSVLSRSGITIFGNRIEWFVE